MKGPLDFGINSPGHMNGDNCGNRIYAIGLPDGREVYVRGDRMTATTGVVEIWTDTHVTKWETVDGQRFPAEREPQTPELTFALPAGSWVHAYMCEAFMNEPWSIGYLAEPGKRYKAAIAT
jgi:hypothetical protein